MNKEQLYKDFTTQLLPRIREGLMINKDYFLDLFGRYVKYLIITDSIYLIVSVIIFIIGVTMVILAIKNLKAGEIDIALFISGIIITISIMGMLVTLNYLLKDFYIPEVRILEEIKNFK